MRFAERMSLIKPSPSSMAGQRVRELRESGRDVIGLTAGEPDFDTPENIQEAAIRAIREGQTKYTDVGGMPTLKLAVIEKFRRENGLEYKQNEIIVSSGAKQVIFNALMCLVQEGDEVIIPVPYWVSYPDMVRFAGGTPVFIECPKSNRFKLLPERLEEAITPRTRCLLLNSPNNPSGASYTEAELKALAAVLLRHPGVFIITDDIYEHLLYDGNQFATIASVEAGLKDRVLTVNGVSKAYAMTGWRIGYAGGNAPLISNMVKLQSQSTSCPSAISQAAAIEALTGPQDVIASSRQVFQARRDLLVERINQIPGLSCIKPEGAFYVFVSYEELMGRRTPQGQEIHGDVDFVLHLAEAQGIVVIPGSAYGMPGFFRVSIATSEKIILDGQKRIAQACAQLG
ncbi:pyridoxal phosphate-dependent aminotransferase [Alcaligenaceae bacterium]|nr:pyridoxal phosphate-dependent aminotransferase [Alcaligenaceae bacterium]